MCKNPRAHFQRVLGLAFLGTISEIIVLSIGVPYILFIVWLYIVEIPVVSIFLVKREKMLWFRSCASGYVFTILINGILEALLNAFGSGVHYVSLLGIACLLSIVGCVWFLRQQRIERCIYPVEICVGEECIKVLAFYDSGNHLKDPYTGSGIQIFCLTFSTASLAISSDKICTPLPVYGSFK